MGDSPVREELRHRGGLLPEAAPEGLGTVLGGPAGVDALITDLYRRMSEDAVLRAAFPRFSHGPAAEFFRHWLAGENGYSDGLAGGIVRRHQDRYVSPATAAAWLRCMRDALVDRGIEPGPVLQPLARIARALVHSPDLPDAELHRRCGGVREPVQTRLEAVLEDARRGRTASVCAALDEEPSLASRRGEHGQSLAWIAVYRRRPEILTLALEAGADPNAPGCDPLHATMACDEVHLGTGLSVTPLALARKICPGMVGPLLEHGARDDVFTAAWLGDYGSLQAQLERSPELADVPDPAEDYQEVTPLAHAVFGGSIECVRLLLERGVDVRRHSGKLLMLAIVTDRPGLAALLIEHGADVRRAPLMGKLDGDTRPVADLLAAHGKRPPRWMLPRACRPDVSRNELHRVRVLLEYGAGLEDRERHGLTALHYAVRGGKLPLISLLLETGADPDARDDAGLTPLLHLSRTRSAFDPLPVLQLLLSHGADPNARDEMGATLLMFYARRDGAAEVSCLLEHGADGTAANRRGQTAAMLARPGSRVRQLLRSGQG